jgi:hypothetical protein
MLVVVIGAGCKKKNEPKPKTPAPVLLTSIKSVVPGTPDSLVNIFSYSYNTQNKLSNIHLGGLNYPLTYNADGEVVNYGGIGGGSIAIQVQYDQNNNPVSCVYTSYDLLSRPEDVEYFTYTLANGLVTQIQRLSSPNGPVVELYNFKYDEAGNVIEQDLFNASGGVIETNKSTFGTHHSPLYTDHIRFIIPNLDDDYFNPNEKLTQTSVNSIGTTQFTFTYTYNGMYPTSMVIGVPAADVKNYFYYTYSGLSN